MGTSKRTTERAKAYVNLVRKAVNDDIVLRLSKREYIEALEEIATDLEGMLEAAREELKVEEDAVRGNG